MMQVCAMFCGVGLKLNQKLIVIILYNYLLCKVHSNIALVGIFCEDIIIIVEVSGVLAAMLENTEFITLLLKTGVKYIELITLPLHCK